MLSCPVRQVAGEAIATLDTVSVYARESTTVSYSGLLGLKDLFLFLPESTRDYRFIRPLRCYRISRTNYPNRNRDQNQYETLDPFLNVTRPLGE